MKLVDSEYIEKPPLNEWTVIHLGAGFLLGYLGVSLRLAIILIVGFELIEQSIGIGLHLAWPPEGTLDSIIDIAIGLIGWFIGNLFSPHKMRRMNK